MDDEYDDFALEVIYHGNDPEARKENPLKVEGKVIDFQEVFSDYWLTIHPPHLLKN